MNRNRTLRVSRGPADRDPMAYRDQLLVLKAIWYDGAATLTPPTEPVQEPGPQWDLAPLPPPSDMQQNDHVMRYWSWRLDRMEAKRNG